MVRAEIEVNRPEARPLPLVLSVPHSGDALLDGEDGTPFSAVEDEEACGPSLQPIVALASRTGVTIVRQLVSRRVVDVDGEPPAGGGQEVARRIHRRYQDAVWAEMQAAKMRAGFAVLFDLHDAADADLEDADLVLAGVTAASTDPRVGAAFLRALADAGVAATEKTGDPGYTVRRVGNPRSGLHALRMLLRLRLLETVSEEAAASFLDGLQKALLRVGSLDLR